MALPFLLPLIGCAPTPGDTATTDGLQDARDALADATWPSLDGFESWAQVDPWTGVQPSSDGTHGEYVQMWLNPAAVDSYDTEATAGSIIAKIGYRDDAGSDPYGNITVMLKPTDASSVPVTGWLWISYASDGTHSKAEDDAGCAGCHSTGDDWRRMKTDQPGG